LVFAPCPSGFVHEHFVINEDDSPFRGMAAKRPRGNYFLIILTPKTGPAILPGFALNITVIFELPLIIS
jgi:hypothetical protein